MFIELGERAAGKRPIHESSRREIAPAKVLEDEREDIKRQVVSIPHGPLLVWGLTGPNPLTLAPMFDPFLNHQRLGGSAERTGREPFLRTDICIMYQDG